MNLEKYDYILSIGTFFENESLKNSLEKACKNEAKFIYMHPIDNFELKDFYTQFIKYEVGSEEAILALILNFFIESSNDNLKKFLENLDIGYLSAESSAGEEEFEEAFTTFENSNSKLLVIGDDIKNHERVENIVALLKNIKKYTDFELIFLDEVLQEKLNSCENYKLEEVEDLKSFNGTLLYSLLGDETTILKASQTFANIAKVKDGDNIEILSKDEKIKRVLKIDENLHGTIAILNIENSINEYPYKQVKIQKEEN